MPHIIPDEVLRTLHTAPARFCSPLPTEDNLANAPAWNERDSKQVASEGIARQTRDNWRKVTITSDPITGQIVVEYAMPNGHAADTTRFGQTEFLEQARNIARTIGFHVVP